MHGTRRHVHRTFVRSADGRVRAFARPARRMRRQNRLAAPDIGAPSDVSVYMSTYPRSRHLPLPDTDDASDDANVGLRRSLRDGSRINYAALFKDASDSENEDEDDDADEDAAADDDDDQEWDRHRRRRRLRR